MFKHILVPLDGSALAEQALPAALALAEKFTGKITLLRVVRPPRQHMTDASDNFANMLLTMRKQSLDEAETYLQAHQGSLRQQGYQVHIHFTENDLIADAILEVISGVDADAIVMSTHGRSGLSRWVFGSVAEKVLRRADVPVLLIRAQASDF